MKKYNLLLCGLIAMLFSACTKDELTETNSQPSGEIVSVTAYAAGSGEDTRVSYTDQGDGSYTLAWEETESFSVIREGYNATFSKTTAGNTFTGALPSGNGDYYAVYPKTESASTTNPQQVPYDLSAQKGVLDKNMTYMYASSEDGTEFQFHHSTAILKATFSGLPDEATIKSVVVTTVDANLKGTQNLTNGKLTSDSSSQQITINFGTAVAANTPVFIYLPPMAANKKGLSFDITTTSNGGYTANLAGTDGKAIEAGKIYNAENVAVSPKVESYLTFTAAEDGQNMRITTYYNILSSKGSDGEDRVFEYSTNGTDWKTINDKLGESIAFENKKLYLRGKSIDGTATSDTEYLKIGFTNTENKVSCSGDIRSLIDYENFETVSTAKAKFINLFTECKTLKGAPELPATTLAEKCYKNMFYGCKALTTAPELPATTLANNCYESMFDGCSALETAPSALPATTLVTECYKYMFYGCKALETAPALPATTLVKSCYYGMFSGCSSLNKVTMLATNIGAQWCLDSWLSGVAATGTFTKAASMTTLPTGSSGIPSGWTVKDN